MEPIIFEALSKYAAVWTVAVGLIILAARFLAKFAIKVFEYFQNQTDVSDTIKQSFEDINKSISGTLSNIEIITKQNQKMSQTFDKLLENYSNITTEVACFHVKIDELRKDVGKIGDKVDKSRTESTHKED